MTFPEIIVPIVMAVLIGLLFYYGFKKTGPWRGFWSFLAILVLAGILASAWANPLGPMLFGVYWVGPLVFIVIFALLIAAVTPPCKEQGDLSQEEFRRSSAFFISTPRVWLLTAWP